MIESKSNTEATLIKFFKTITFCIIAVVVHGNSLDSTTFFKPKIEYFSIPNNPINAEEISDIKIDSKGNVWVLSFKALYRYDGVNFRKISPNYNSFGSLIRFYESDSGQKFVLDYWGGIYLIKNDSLYEHKSNEEIRKYFKSYGYSDIRLNQEGLHFSFHASSYKILKNNEIVDPLEEKNIKLNGFACRIMKQGLPFAFRNKSAKQHSNKYFYLIGNDFDILDSIQLVTKREFNPTTVVKLKDDEYLYSNGKGNLIRFSSNKILESYEIDFEVLNLFVDKGGNLWISTRDKGVLFFENGVVQKDQINIIDSGPMTIVAAQDYQGGIWLYSQENGIGYISHPEVKYLTSEKTIKPLVEALVSDGSHIYYAEESKLKRLDFELQKELQLKDLEEQIMRLKYDDKNRRLWISTRGGIYYRANNGQVNRIKNIPQDFKASFSQFDSDWDNSNVSIVGTNDYQYFICKDSSISYVSKKYEHKLKGVLLNDDTTILNTGNGIYLETKDTLKYLGDQFDVAKKFANQFLLVKNDALISIPSEGLFVYNGKKFEALNYNAEIIPKSKLIKQDSITVWAISNYGCFRIKRTQGNYQVEAFGQLPRMVIKGAVIHQNEIILQSRISGIGFIKTDQVMSKELSSPKLLIEKVIAKGDVYYDSYNLGTIPYQDNNIQIHFKSLNYHNLDVQYRYRVNHNNESWNYTTTGYVNYVSLEPNKYQFEVQSRFGLGNWSETQLVSFEIVPPFWEEWWFLTLSGVFILIGIYFIASYRFKIINKEKSLIIGRLTAEQKSLRAKMDPHFMFNIISSVQYLILRKENEKAIGFLNRFSSLLRNTLNQADNENIKIKDEIKFLQEYIDLEKLRLEDKFDYNIEIDSSLDTESTIPTFVLQPFVENAIHHGLKGLDGVGELKVSLVKSQDFLIIEITDNGIGYNRSIEAKNKKHLSHGIQTIKDRLKIYNGSNSDGAIQIIDIGEYEAGTNGTKVIVRIKLK